MEDQPTVLLIDHQDETLNRVAGRLRELAGAHYQVRTQSIPAGAVPQLPDAHLIIAPESLRQSLDSLEAEPLYWTREADPNPSPGAISLLAGARAMDRAIRGRLPGRAGHEHGTAESGHLGCHLSFSLAKGQAITRAILAQEMNRGRRMVYLPIMPLYQMTDSFRRGPGQTLGDLLCLIASGDLPEVRSMGQWLYFHERGYFTFHLPERADDLISCDTGTLRKLVHLLKRYARESREPSCVWLDTQGLPLEKLKALAALCDFIHLDIPSGSSSADLIARREVGILMAGLPGTCSIYEQGEGIEESGLAGGL